MISYEKSMLAIPNRYFARGNRMFVSFNIAHLPVDLPVTGMVLHIPLPARTTIASMPIHEIAGGWDEALMATGFTPAIGAQVSYAICPPEHPEVLVDLFSCQHVWRFKSEENHGVYVDVISPGMLPFQDIHVPYLLITTN
jgi:hypothetical protein